MTKSFWTALLAIAASSTRVANAVDSYTVFDDFSWAIKSFDLSTPEKQAFYRDYMQKCAVAAGDHHQADCVGAEKERINMNQLQPMSMKNYTKNGFLKVKAPEDLRRLLTDFWEKNKDQQEIELGGGVKEVNSFQNAWDTPPTFVDIGDASLEGGGMPLRRAIESAAKSTLEEWTGQRLEACSSYGIRVYHDKSILAPHVDRLPLVSSAIINVAQDVEEPWPLEVFGHDGYAVNVTMEPGDMVLYESHSIIHGRPFPMKGNYYANIFIHFEPLGPLEETPEGTLTKKDPAELPPYIVPGTPWDSIYRQRIAERGTLSRHFNRKDDSTHPDNPNYLTHTGNLEHLMLVVKQFPEAVHNQDQNGWTPLHESLKEGHMHILRFLIDNGADVNAPTHQGIVPLWLAEEIYGPTHPMTALLRENGANRVEPEL